MINIKKVAAFVLLYGMIVTPPVFAESILSSLTDSVNSGIINTKIITDQHLKNINIDATVVNGIAIFSGEVYSKAQVSELIRITRTVTGIKGIDLSKLRVRSH